MSSALRGAVVIESLYHRDQFDDWLAGGRLEIGDVTCYWEASDSCAGFGWVIEPAVENVGWPDLTEAQSDAAVLAVERALQAHRSEYRF